MNIEFDSDELNKWIRSLKSDTPSLSQRNEDLITGAVKPAFRRNFQVIFEMWRFNDYKEPFGRFNKLAAVALDNGKRIDFEKNGVLLFNRKDEYVGVGQDIDYIDVVEIRPLSDPRKIQYQLGSDSVVLIDQQDLDIAVSFKLIPTWLIPTMQWQLSPIGRNGLIFLDGPLSTDEKIYED